MSGRNLSKTNTEEKKKAAKERRENMDLDRQKTLSILDGNAEIRTDDKPIIKYLAPANVKLRSISAQIGKISRPGTEVVIEKVGATSKEQVSFQVEEGFNKGDIVVNIPADCILLVYVNHPDEFRVEDIYFSALITNK